MKIKFYITIFLFCFLVAAIQSRAQFMSNGISLNYFGQLDNTSGSNFNWTRSIGIGYFGSGFPNSFLHINSNIGLLPDNGSIANYGEVFRTDAPADVTTAWRMFSGNVAANEKFNIRNTTGTNNVVFGTVQSGHLDFHTANAFRGRLTSDGALYISGASGSNPNLGSGTRLMWVPIAGAFRAGTVNGSQWDSGSVGINSFAGGFDNVASGDYSTAFGSVNNVSGKWSFAAGIANEITGNGATALGINNKCLNEGAIALGDDNVVEGHDAVAAGELCHAKGWASIATGYNVRALADKSVVIGNGLPLVNNIQNSMMVGFNHDEATLFVGGAQYADDFGKVGVATSQPTARFHVERDASGEAPPATYTTARINMTGATGGHKFNEGLNISLETQEESGTEENNGLIVNSKGAMKNFGGRILATAAQETAQNSGLHVVSVGTSSLINKGIVSISTAGNLSHNSAIEATATGGVQTVGLRASANAGSGMTIGVLASASGAIPWAGWFNGNVFSSGAFIPSDESLKTNVSDAGSSLEKVSTLKVKTYEYQISTFSSMNLPEGEQTGLMAENVELSFPELVKQAVQPADVNNEGAIISDQISFKAVNYAGLVPHLVGSIQELKSIIDAQQAQIETLTALVQNCCTPGEDKSQNQGPNTPK